MNSQEYKEFMNNLGQEKQGDRRSNFYKKVLLNKKSLRNTVREICNERSYSWGEHDCISLTERIFDLEKDSLREDWMLEKTHAKVISGALSRYGTVRRAYFSLLTRKHGFRESTEARDKRIFVTPEKGNISVFYTMNSLPVKNAPKHKKENLLREPVSIQLPFAIMGIVAERQEHLYLGYEGLFIVCRSNKFRYLYR